MRHPLFAFATASLLLVLPLACQRPAPPPPAAASRGIDAAGMDPSVAPGDDFNAHANGGWIKVTEIPPDRSSYSPWAILIEQMQKRTVDLIQALASDANATAEARKIGDYYNSFMDEAGIEAKGLAPLKPALEAIAAITDKKGLATAIGGTLRADVDPLNYTNFETEHLFGVFVAQGLREPDRYMPYLLQGGLGLPDRDYYVSATPAMAKLKAAYQHYVVQTFTFAGSDDPAGRAARVVALETKIARAHATRLESADVSRPETWKREEMAKKAPGLDWAAFLEAAGLKAAPELIVWHPKATTGVAALVASEPLQAWKDWLTFHAISEVSSFLPQAFVDNQFEFYGKALSGTQSQRPRWRRGIDNTNGALGEAVGRVYVEKFFPAETKARVQAMVGNIVKAFSARVDALSWMTPVTKAKAHEKIGTLRVGVGYPDSWRDYSGLEIVKGDALGNARRAYLFEYRHQLGKLGRPVDSNEWWIRPQEVNALNLPLQNALNFPAAFLQPPFFDPGATDAVNYGSMGAVIGHEISHSFDDTGSQFDAKGRLSNWWTPEDLAHFKTASEALVKQYDAYKPLPDLNLNGRQTLGENIADVAGLSAAYDAYKASLAGASAPGIDNFSGDQQFFLSYAQSWRQKAREALLRQQIATDGHAPAGYRALTVRNLDAWYGAFNVQPGQKLYLAPAERVKVW